MADANLEMLQQMQSVLMKMHRLLMASQKTELEAKTGKSVNSTEWLQLMMTDARYAWLKSMLTLISDIDALMDNHRVSERDLQIIRLETEKLFLTGDGTNTDFNSHYKRVVQTDSDVILLHSQLRNKIQSLPAGKEIQEALDIRKNWHVKPKAIH